MAAFFIGAAIGVVQFWLLKIITHGVLTGNGYLSVILGIIVKLAVYTAAVAVMIIWFADYILPCGIGLGTAIIVAAVIWFLTGRVKSKKTGDDVNK